MYHAPAEQPCAQHSQDGHGGVQHDQGQGQLTHPGEADHIADEHDRRRREGDVGAGHGQGAVRLEGEDADEELHHGQHLHRHQGGGQVVVAVDDGGDGGVDKGVEQEAAEEEEQEGCDLMGLQGG